MRDTTAKSALAHRAEGRPLPVIDIVALRRRFVLGTEVVEALRGVDLKIAAGEYVAIVGPSGSGKSTLMNLIGCLDTPTQGSYFLDGEEVHRLDDDQLAEIRNRKIGFVFQSFNLLPRATAVDNVALPLLYSGRRRAARRQAAVEALSRVQLGGRLYHRPDQLSGGQKQRVLLARALYKNPRLLFLDEATSHLDAAREEQINQAIKQLPLTRILIAHRASTIASASRVVRMEEGELVADMRQLHPAETDAAGAPVGDAVAA